jgi:hypothetical protein
VAESHVKLAKLKAEDYSLIFKERGTYVNVKEELRKLN